MSEETIARWNAIPMERSEESDSRPGFLNLKRPREHEDQYVDNNNGDDDDDDVSIVSRSPSPVDTMDVDESTNIHDYDSYVRKPAREVITVDTKIKPSNKGFALLAKLGWVEGQPIGLSGEGRVDPIPFHIKTDSMGLGKINQDYEMIELTAAQRRELDSERQRRENEDQKKQREDAVARKQAIDAEISNVLRAFYCSLCDKQFKTVAQYDEHTNSYAHHHKARLKDMQANIRITPQEELEKRKEKERKREEKELRKMAAANGIKMPKSLALTTPSTSTTSTTTTIRPQSGFAPISDGSTAANTITPSSWSTTAFKPSGWSTVSSSNATIESSSSSPSGGFKKAGWATVGSGASTSADQRTSSPLSTSHDSSQAAAASLHGGFRTGGWTSLETSSPAIAPPAPTAPPPPPPPGSNASPPPPPPSTFAHPAPLPPGGPSSLPLANPSLGPPKDNNNNSGGGGGWARGGFVSINERNQLGRFGSQHPGQTQPRSGPPPSLDPAPPPPPPSSAPPPQKQPKPSKPAPASDPDPPRANSWQQFQKGVRRR